MYEQLCSILVAGLLLTQLALAAIAKPQRVNSLEITVLSTMLADEGICEWAYAALLEAGKKILFDTGARPQTVLSNARELKVDL